MVNFSGRYMPFQGLLAVVCWSLVTFAFSSAQAAGIKEVVTASPAWDTLTNQDGTGLYHEVLQEVFSFYGIKVRHIYSQSGRSEELVRENLADIMTCDDKVLPPLVKGRYPMYVNDFYVFFRKGRIGEWRGNESLRGREVLAQRTFYTSDNFPVAVRIKEVQDGTQALAMILLNRSDFYVDDMSLIQQAMRENSIPFDAQAFDMRKVGRRSYFPLFNSTARGARIMKMYNDGIARLHGQGKLKPFYDKWGYQYPDFDRY